MSAPSTPCIWLRWQDPPKVCRSLTTTISPYLTPPLQLRLARKRRLKVCDLKKTNNSQQVQLGNTGDPYCHAPHMRSCRAWGSISMICEAGRVYRLLPLRFGFNLCFHTQARCRPPTPTAAVILRPSLLGTTLVALRRSSLRPVKSNFSMATTMGSANRCNFRLVYYKEIIILQSKTCLLATM